MNAVFMMLILAIVAPEPEAKPVLTGPMAHAEMPVF